MGDTSIKFEVIPGKNQKSEYVMTCGKHTVRGWCKYEHLCFLNVLLSLTACVCLTLGKNKRVGKQLASQKILQMLHPHVKNWGSLLRMYGRENNKMVKKVRSFEISVLTRVCSPASTAVSLKWICGFLFDLFSLLRMLVLQESSDKSVIELQQYAKKNKPNLHILNKLQEEMKKLASQRVRSVQILTTLAIIAIITPRIC